MNNMAKKFSTTVEDRFIAAMDGIFIPIIQLEMEFDYYLDEHRLAKAVALTMDAAPILCCRFVPRTIRPYWESVEKEKYTIFALVKNKNEYEAFRGKGIEFISEPQMCTCLYRSERKDRFILKISHVVSDTTGVKEIAAILSNIYNRLAYDPDYYPTPEPCNPRSYWHIVRNIPWYVYPRIVINYIFEIMNSLIPYQTQRIPIKKTSGKVGKYITRYIEKEALTHMINYGKKRNATLNDVLLAAIFRALSKIGEWDGKAALRIAITIDLRRYLPKIEAWLLANFSSMEMITHGTSLEDDFESTLKRVVHTIKTRKSSWLGLNAVVSIYLGFWALPFSVFNRFIKKSLEFEANSSNASDWFTNFGEIPMEDVYLGGNPTRVWILPPGCNLPIAVYGCSVYDGGLSLNASVMTDDDGMNETAVNTFFDFVISELPLTTTP